MFFTSNYFYISLALQGVCVWHCVKKGNQNKWIYIIMFLPVVGPLIYIFSEMFGGREINQLQSGVGAVFNPSGRIKKLEENLRFSDTFNNKVLLADAYLDAGQAQRAIDLYNSVLTGNFTENEHVLSQLIIANYKIKKFDAIIPLGKKMYGRPQFLRSHPHIIYAIALGEVGKPEEAEQEFLKMQARYANFEARYQYAMFLSKFGKNDEARELLKVILSEADHLTGIEKRDNREWFRLAKEALVKIKQV